VNPESEVPRCAVRRMTVWAVVAVLFTVSFGCDRPASHPIQAGAVVPVTPGGSVASRATFSGDRPVQAPRTAFPRPLISTPTQLPSFQAGPVLNAPRIYAVYWGTFSTDQVSSMQAYLPGLAKYLSGAGAPSGQEPTARQYGVTGCTVSGSYTDASVPGKSIGTSDVEAKIGALQTAGSIPASAPDILYMVFTKGITFNDGYGDLTPTGYCGYHSYDSSRTFQFTLNPYPALSDCGMGGWSNLSELTVWEAQASHEVQEAATDPEPFTGWIPEIGDQCNWGDDPTNVGSFSFGGVQKVVDKAQSSCSNWTPVCGARNEHCCAAATCYGGLSCSGNSCVCPADCLASCAACQAKGIAGACAICDVCRRNDCLPPCGGSGQRCCGNSTCDSGLACVTGACEACGAQGEVCCAGVTCSGTLACSSGKCSQPCGNQGQSCCAGSTCSAGLSCSGGSCIAPACGGLAEKCCSGSTCKGGLSCNGNKCACPVDCAGACSVCQVRQIAGACAICDACRRNGCN
jgi:hypothetical protein